MRASALDPPQVQPGFWARDDVRQSLQDQDTGQLFRLLGRHAGLSQTRIGTATGLGQGRVSEIARGKRHVAAARVLERIADGLGMPPSARSDLGITPALLPHQAASGEDLRERLTAAAERAPAPPPDAEKIRRSLDDALAAGMMSPQFLRDWEGTVARYGYRTRDTPSPLLLSELTSDLADLRLTITRHRSASALPRLTAAAANVSGLVVLTLIKAGDRQAWRRWGRTARHAAAESGDAQVTSWVMAQEAYGWYYADDMREAIASARAAREAGYGTGVGSALAAALEMRACAATGDRTGAGRAYTAAETALARLSGAQLDASAFGYNEAQLRFHAGSAWVTLGDTAAASEAASRAIELCAPGDYTDWALSKLDLAACRSIDGDPDQALGETTGTLRALDPPRRLGIISNRARALLASLPESVRTLPAARDVRGLLEEPKELFT